MLRSILVGLDGTAHSEAAATLARDWALRFGARVVGVGVLDEPTITKAVPVPIGAGAYKKERDEARLSDARERVRSFLDGFEQRCADAKVAAEVRETVGRPAERILKEAQRCDLVMLGRETHFHFETQDSPDSTLGEVIRGSARPVVVVPQERAEGRGVMVAYGGGSAVVRALQTLQLLGLVDGEPVHLVSAHREGWEAPELATLAADFLATHGTASQLHELKSERPTADVLLDHLRLLRPRPRLLVVGGHGHHPVRELFFTSVTRALVLGSPVPVFIGF